MVQLIQASNLNLGDVKERFHLQEMRDSQFFSEWQGDLPELSDAEKQWLDQIKDNFLSFADYPLHEEIIKLSVLAPLLFLAGLMQLPFNPEAEKPVEIALETEDEIIRGRIDVLILHQRLWAIVIEAKRNQLNVREALPQALFYMLSSPANEKPIFGLMLNGTEVQFVKLVKHAAPHYGLSRLFSLANPGNDLYVVLGILKQLRAIVLQ
ncbi:MAG: restriction endonuclease subunit R [Tildeniella nuda ZEHNDER 1965/U140]|jgi:hypothetical protein|nr:restriction endonuclease subunit R [Tildeniella nuda ZEHNDER 1965/U140]